RNFAGIDRKFYLRARAHTKHGNDDRNTKKALPHHNLFRAEWKNCATSIREPSCHPELGCPTCLLLTGGLKCRKAASLSCNVQPCNMKRGLGAPPLSPGFGDRVGTQIQSSSACSTLSSPSPGSSA